MSWLKGRKQSPEHLAKRIAAIRASGNYERASKRMRGNIYGLGRKQSEESKRKKSLKMCGKRNSLGVKRSLEFRQNLSKFWTNNPNHNHYIDGKGAERTSERNMEMGRLEYRLWREAVFKRDNYTCLKCGERGVYLQADHIKPYCLYPELRTNIENGRTLCVPCHRKTDTYGSKALKKLEEVPL